MDQIDGDAFRRCLADASAPDAVFRLGHPVGDCQGADGFYDAAIAPLRAAMPDVERRDFIRLAGRDDDGADWVGVCGQYLGTFLAPWLDIPPTGHLVHMRFHEFYRIAGGKITEMQGIWDIPEVMMQAGAWPMGPALGRTWPAPAPATSDGVRTGDRDPADSERSAQHVIGMLGDMGRHPTEPEEAMRLDQWWHEKFSWYGPAGIGTARGVTGFRHWHQIPFLNAMPDRRGGYRGEAHFFADGPFVGVTAWPGMEMTFTGGGFLGIPPTGQELTMRSLDFWRIEDTPEGPKIRENWVLVDLLSHWDQLGVDVLARMRELTKPLSLY